MKSNTSLLFNYFTFPALIYLSVTLLSGIWIRLQWVIPYWALFNPKFAIHAHSHLAMLGWLFPILLRLLLPKSAPFTITSKMLVLLLHFTIIAMFPAFLYEGYALWSITFSSLFIIFSYILIYLYRRELQLGVNILNSLAIGLYLLSTVGPWALGGAARFGLEWLTAWIAFFLHLQFNGWVTFAVLAILSKDTTLLLPAKIGFSLLAIGTVFVTPGLMYTQLSPWWHGLVYGGSSFLVIGGLLVSYFAIKNSSLSSVKTVFVSLFLIKTLSISFIIFDFAQPWIHHIHSFRVAFTHFVLLSWGSSVILFAQFGLTRFWLLFFAAALLKGCILTLDAFQWINSSVLPFSLQWVYIVLGVLLLISLFGLIYLHFVSNVTVRYRFSSLSLKGIDEKN